MKKLTSLKALVALLALTLAFGMTACDQEDLVNEPESVVVNYDSPEWEVDDANYVTYDLEEGDVENELALRPPPPNHGDSRMRDRRPPSRERIFFGRIFRAMEIDRAQAMLIREFMKEHHDCLRDIMLSTREDRITIIRQANEDRRDVIERLRDGEIDRDQALEEIRVINEQVREDLRALADVDARCECLHQLLRGIASVLDEDQLEMWNRFVDSLRGPCFEDEEGGE